MTMNGNMTDYMKNLVLSKITGRDVEIPAAVYAGLLMGGEDNMAEADYAGYQRKLVVWAAPRIGMTTNFNVFSFESNPTAAILTMTGVAMYDQEVGGNALFVAQLDEPVVAGPGGSFEVDIGALDMVMP